MTDTTTTHQTCPDHPGHAFHRSTGACSCGQGHHVWSVVTPTTVPLADAADDDYVTVTATITDRWDNTDTVFAGSQPVWAWKLDRCPEWRTMMRALLLADRTSDPRGWRVTFDGTVHA